MNSKMPELGSSDWIHQKMAVLIYFVEWLETRRKLKGGWPETYKGFTLKLQDLLKYLKSLNYDKITKFIEKNSKGNSAIQTIRRP